VKDRFTAHRRNGAWSAARIGRIYLLVGSTEVVMSKAAGAWPSTGTAIPPAKR
jgi:hypothetical protein